MLAEVHVILKLFAHTLVLFLLMLAYSVPSTSGVDQPILILIRSLKRRVLMLVELLPLWAHLLLWVLPWLITMVLLTRLLNMV